MPHVAVPAAPSALMDASRHVERSCWAPICSVLAGCTSRVSWQCVPAVCSIDAASQLELTRHKMCTALAPVFMLRLQIDDQTQGHQREKLVGTLKDQIKKLQKDRDKIKAWCATVSYWGLHPFLIDHAGQGGFLRVLKASAAQVLDAF
jgi:Not1 N-terminal domain, CCR4-Not complex component